MERMGRWMGNIGGRMDWQANYIPSRDVLRFPDVSRFVSSRPEIYSILSRPKKIITESSRPVPSQTKLSRPVPSRATKIIFVPYQVYPVPKFSLQNSPSRPVPIHKSLVPSCPVLSVPSSPNHSQNSWYFNSELSSGHKTCNIAVNRGWTIKGYNSPSLILWTNSVSTIQKLLDVRR